VPLRAEQYFLMCQAFALVALLLTVLSIAPLVVKRVAATRRTNPVDLTGAYDIAASIMLCAGTYVATGSYATASCCQPRGNAADV